MGRGTGDGGELEAAGGDWRRERKEGRNGQGQGIKGGVIFGVAESGIE